MLFERAIILAKLEGIGNYGVNSNPDAANDAFVTTVPVYTPLGEHRERQVARSSMALPPGINVGQGLQIEFGVELRGTATGLNDEPPKIFRLLQACSLTQVIVSLVSATLNPHSNHDGDSLSMIVNFDGTQHLILGCRGDYEWSFPNNDVVMCNFTFQGIYAGDHASAVAFPTGVFTDTPERIIFRASALSFNSVSDLVFENITFGPKNNLFRRPGSGSASGTHSYSIVGRAPEASLEPEAVALATLNPFEIYDLSTNFDIQWTAQDPDSTPGQVFTFKLFNCQIQEPPGYGQRESLRTWPLVVKPHAADVAVPDADFQIVCSLPTES